MKKQRIRCKVKTLSPVHVGCDEVYEPTGFTVDEENGSLVVFDPLAFIAGLSEEDRHRFSEICKKGTVQSILEIYRFLRNRRTVGRSVKVCGGFPRHYNQVLEVSADRLKNELNRFKIERTAFLEADRRPYIPGSAIKGALRTAYLNRLSDNAPDYSSQLRRLRHEKARIKEHRWLEEKLLGLDKVPSREKISKDPFRLVKVSDFIPLGDSTTKIVYAVNRKKKPTDKHARGPNQILECIEPGTVFVGEITVESPQAPGATSLTINLGKLLDSALQFFGAEKAREERELQNIGVPVRENPGNVGVLIRMGRHSGAESVTIRRYRDIKIMLGKKGKTFEDHATTLWLASETSKPGGNASLTPFGWAMLSELSAEEEARLRSEEKTFQERRIEERRKREEKQRALEIAKEREAKLEEEKKQREEEERLAEEKRKAEIEAMTPEERAVFDLENPSTEENRVYEIYRELDGFGEENKQKAALLLKQRWQNEGRWKKRDCSKKQWQKVQQIEKILDKC